MWSLFLNVFSFNSVLFAMCLCFLSSRVLDEMHRADEEAADEMMYLARKGRRKAKLAAAAQHISADEGIDV